jgi:hypothetical protein
MTQVISPKKGETSIGKANREESIRLKDLHPSEATVRTNAAAPHVIAGTDQPRAGDQIDGNRITLPPLSGLAVGNAAADAGVGEPKRWPDFALGVIKIAVAREAVGSEKLKALSAQVKEQLGDIDLLLEFSSELTALPDKDSHNVTDKMRSLIAKLEIHKIQVWKSGEKISKEKLGELKAQISSQIDKLRTAMQTKISTEIQPEANNLQSIMNIVQQVIQSDARLKRKTSEVPR